MLPFEILTHTQEFSAGFGNVCVLWCILNSSDFSGSGKYWCESRVTCRLSSISDCQEVTSEKHSVNGSTTG